VGLVTWECFGTSGMPPPSPVTFNQIGNILSTPRTLKLQAGVRFPRSEAAF
jgi:hypothetical protein